MTGQSPVPQVVTVSAASYASMVAPDSIAAAFGAGLATEVRAALSAPLPTLLAGTTVRVNGEAAPLFFVSPGQINFLIPAGTPAGTASVVVTAGDGKVSSGTVQVVTALPALFTADASGSGPLAAQLYRYNDRNELKSIEPLARYDEQEKKFVTRPFEFGEASDQLFLVLYLTGIRQAATSNVRVNLGGVEFVPLYAGPSGGFIGLDQINVALPRSFGGRGRISLLVRAAGAGSSNSGEFEIASGATSGVAPVQLTGVSVSPVLASEELEISGSGFAANPRENTVQIVADDGVTTKAEVVSVSGERLRIRVPFGAGTGKLRVVRGESEASQSIAVRTSVSGFIEESRAQADGSLKPVPIPGARVRLYNQPATARSVSADGSFVIADPPAGLVTVEVVLPAGGGLPFPNPLHKLEVKAGRDNQFPRSAELARTGGATAPGGEESARTESVSVLTEGFTLTYFPAGRTPFNLPTGHFSSRIAQITPFRLPITPATKLSFPNADAIPVGTAATLFRFDQTVGSSTLGEFIPAGPATVSADGQMVETAADAITEASYYFVSIPRPLAAINGRVVESNGRPVPRAIVQVRGQSTFTDGFGGFVLRNVPVLKASGDKVRVEVSYQRPDGSISRKLGTEVELTANALATITPEIVLDPVTRNLPPVILAPAALTLNAGETGSFDLIALDPNSTQTLQLNTSGTATSFTTLSSQGSGVYRLQMNPATNAAGSYTLNLTAQDATNNNSSQSIAVTVSANDASKPVAQSQAITTPEDTPKAITLTGSNLGSGSLTYSIVSPPTRGTLTGTAPNLSYMPALNFNGNDTFTFKAGNGNTESQVATVNIAVSPVNDPPALGILSNPTINAGETLNTQISVSDPDEDQKLSFAIAGLPAGASFQEAGESRYVINWTPGFQQAGDYTVTITVSDNATPSLSQTLRVTLSAVAKWMKTSGPIESGTTNALLRVGRTFYAGTSGAGVFRSDDEGQSWAPVNNGLTGTALDIRKLAAIGTVIYAGTNSSGVWRTTDGGLTWNAVNSGLTSSFNVRTLLLQDGTLYVSGSSVARLNPDGITWTTINNGLPVNTVYALSFLENTLYATVNLSLWRLNNEAQTWSLAVAFPSSASFTPETLITYGGTLYAGGSFSGFFRLSNDRQSWETVNVGLNPSSILLPTLIENAGTLYACNNGGTIYVLSPDAQKWSLISFGVISNLARVTTLLFSDGTIYAGTEKAIFRADNAFRQWKRTETGILASQVFALQSFRGFLYAATLNGNAISRTADGGKSWQVFNTGINSFDGFINARVLIVHNNTLFAGVGASVYRLSDDGTTWVRTSLTGTDIFALASNGTILLAGSRVSVISLSSDDGQSWTRLNNGQPVGSSSTLNSLAINGSTFYVGAGNTIYHSIDNGQSWSILRTGLPAAVNQAFSLIVRNSTVYAGTNFGVYRLDEATQTWTPVGTNIRNVRTLLNNGSVLYAGAFSSGTFNGGVFRYSNEEQTWIQVRTGLTNLNIASLAFDNEKLFAGTQGEGTVLLANNGQSWTEINTGITNKFTNSLAVSGNQIFTGTLGSGILRSGDQGANWTAANTGLPPNANIQGLVNNGAVVFAASFGDGVYRSSDQGATWIAVNTGLTNKFVNHLFLSGSSLYAGTDGGVFRSTDNSVTWSALNSGLTTLRVTAFGNIAGTVYAGTDGGGIFRLDGNAWTAVNNGLTTLSVKAISAQGTTLYAGTIGGGIFISRDSGTSWAAVNNQLPEELNIYSFAVSGKKVYAGSIYGVFLTEDEGQTWKQVNAGLLNTFVTGLAVSGDQLFASTASGGVFVSRIPQLP